MTFVLCLLLCINDRILSRRAYERINDICKLMLSNVCEYCSIDICNFIVFTPVVIDYLGWVSITPGVRVLWAGLCYIIEILETVGFIGVEISRRRMQNTIGKRTCRFMLTHPKNLITRNLLCGRRSSDCGYRRRIRLFGRV